MWKIISLVAFTLVWAYASSQTEEFSITDCKNVTCCKNLTSPAGSFNLKETNLSHAVCYWVIDPVSKAKHSEPKVNIFFSILFLHANDVVTLYKNLDDAINDTPPLMNPLYAQNGSVTVLTNEKVVVIKLKGNDTSYIRQFEGLYQAEGKEFIIILYEISKKSAVKLYYFWDVI
ncbi:uncharacterized protein LOC118205550, partial [Stegodyphus dumicola]|uniref:uncharacterized protein LOC118205550 n=1 Tax=Stegodyphus dumicola TaxID=202533 RepID=UPI0015AC9133